MGQVEFGRHYILEPAAGGTKVWDAGLKVIEYKLIMYMKDFERERARERERERERERSRIQRKLPQFIISKQEVDKNPLNRKRELYLRPTFKTRAAKLKVIT